MATRAVTLVKDEKGTVVATWAAMVDDGDDAGGSVSMGPISGLTWGIRGTNGNDGAFTLQGSVDNTNWGTCQDVAGNNLSAKTAPATGVTFFLVGNRLPYFRVVQTEGEPSVTTVVHTLSGQRVATV